MKFEKGRALVVGIAKYKEVNGLPAAVEHDAGDIADLLKSPGYCGFPEENVRVLVNDKATLADLRAALRDLCDVAAANETVIIFFSGHGARFDEGGSPTSALVAFDTKLADVAGTTLTEAELTEALSGISAQRLVVMIDACHAGGVGVLKGGSSEAVSFGFDEKSLTRLSQGRGRVIMASSRAIETSLVLDGSRNSVFTEGLLRALRGGARTDGDGLIRVFDTFNYVAAHVKGQVSERQHPIFKATDLENNFPIALELGGSKSAVGSSTSTRDDSWQTIGTTLADLYPRGPDDQEVWQRAGGDISKLRLHSTGSANWSAALRVLKQGGGGRDINVDTLVDTALEDFPNHPILRGMKAR